MFHIVAIIVILLIFLLMGGFYLPDQWLLPALGLFILSGVTLLYKMLRGRMQIHSSALALFVLPLLYAGTLFFKVQSVEGTLLEILKWLVVASAGLLIFWQLFEKNGKRTLETAVLMVAIVMVLLSFAVMFHVLPWPGFVLETASGPRMSGPFGYPNVYGAIAGADFLFVLLLVMKRDYGKRFAQSALLLPAVGFLLLASGSRGAWIVFAIAWFTALWQFSSFHGQFRFAVYTAVSFAAGFGSYLAWVQGHLCLLLLIQALGMLLIYYTGKKQLSFKRELPRWFMPAALFVLTVLLLLDILKKGLFFRLLPNAIKDRLHSGSGTFTERLLYVKDMLHHPELYLWNGAGGGAWKNVMYQVQSEPYISHELHNGYANWLLELGIFGFLIITGSLVYLMVHMFKDRSITAPVLLLIALHGLIDFTFSYGFVLLFILCLLAIWQAEKIETRLPDNKLPVWLSWAGSAMILLMLGAGSCYAYAFYQGEQAFQLAKNSPTKEEAMAFGESAVDYNPYNIAYRLYLAELSDEGSVERRSLLKQGLAYEPDHALLWYRYGESLFNSGKEHAGMKAIEKSIELDRFDRYKYEAYMRLLLQASKINGDPGLARKALDVYQKCQRLSEAYRKSGIYENQRDFGITKKMEKMKRKALTL